MAFGRSKSSPDESSTGLKRELTSFVRDASSYAKLRSELFAIEAREAAETYGRKLALLIAGATLLVFGYGLLMAGVIGVMGSLMAGKEFTLLNWIGATLILSAIHFVLGVILLKKGQKTGSTLRAFEYTRNEFKKDQEWLNHKKRP